MAADPTALLERAKAVLADPPCDYVASEGAAPLSPGPVRSVHPARPSVTLWEGAPEASHIDQAVAAARSAQGPWALRPQEERFAALRRVQERFQERAEDIALLIAAETGKPLWEARQEAAALSGKIDITLDEQGPGLARVRPYEVAITPTRTGRAFFRPHGVMAVVGPFNFPAHLPNGHIVPALAMGCAVVFKPSEKTPATGQLLAQLFREGLAEAGADPALVTLVHGAGDVAAQLVSHSDIDGVLFTGSWPVGRRILEANLDRPSRLIALEMGGDNASLVLEDADLKQAVVECCRTAYATAGQRCTCCRRIVVHRAVADRFIDAFVRCAGALVVGDPLVEDPAPFMGPVIRPEVRDAALAFVEQLEAAGAEPLLAPRAVRDVPGCEAGGFLTPGLHRVERFVAEEDPRHAGCDVEVFAPVARLCVVSDFEEGLAQVNATRYGLAASIFTCDVEKHRAFQQLARAGCVNVNTGTAGASSALPFGGLGLSGNHRPAAAFAPDYCVHPVASLVETGAAAATSPGMAFDDAWLS